MKYDCFTFFNELDLLELRLNILKDVVDKFVLVEATRTQNNQEKPLYYKENKERYKEFQDRIIHVIVDDFPSNLSKWTIENHQRNCISRGLKECDPEDLVIISDLDEIPNPELLKTIVNPEKIIAFDLNCFHHYLNNLTFGLPWDHGCKIVTYNNFQTILDDDGCDHGALDEKVNTGTTASKIRLYSGPRQKRYDNAGWHFCYLGKDETVFKKIQAICEGNLNVEPESVKYFRSIKEFAGFTLVPVKIDKSYPEYLVLNISKYPHLVCPNAKFKAKTLLYYSNLFIRINKVLKRIMKNFTADKIFKSNKRG